MAINQIIAFIKAKKWIAVAVLIFIVAIAFYILKPTPTTTPPTQVASPSATTGFPTQTQPSPQYTGALEEKVDPETITQSQALAKIRTSSPIQQEGFTIEYTRTDNTYTITLQQPYTETKAAATNWLKNQGVTDLSTLKLNWVQH